MTKLVLVVLAGIGVTVLLIRLFVRAESGHRRGDGGPMVFGPDSDGDGGDGGGD